MRREIDQNTTLECAPSVTVNLHSPTNVRVLLNGRSVDAGRHTLAVLAAFTQPTRVADAIRGLADQVTGPQEWMEITAAIVRLFESGVLRNGSETPPTMGIDPFNFDAAPEQVAMLNDRARTSRYIAGIREVVRPGDVVVEVGTGTGVLAVAAARAGASRVYAIEAGAIGKTARAVFGANGLADRITLVEGWSTDVELPEKADVLISEIIGNDPLGEGVLEFTADAIRRFLKPGARILPSRLRILGLPVTIPDERLLKRTYTRITVDRWQDWYGIDFRPLAEAAAGSSHFFYMWPQLACDWPVLAEPLLLADLDLGRIEGAAVRGTRTFQTMGAGRLNGLLIYFELQLGPDTWLSTHPGLADPANCWSSPIWMYPDAWDVEPGETFEVTYRYRVPGSRDGLEITRRRADG